MRTAAGSTLLVVLLWVFAPAQAHEYTSNGVTVAHPWARATPGGAKVGGVFLEIKARKGDRLVAARSPVAASAEIHSHVVEGGIVKMRRIDALAVRGGQSIVFRPGGYHVMLIDLKQPLKEGDLTKVTLVFEKAGEIEIDATVESIGAMGPHGFKEQPGSDSDSGAGRQHKH